MKDSLNILFRGKEQAELVREPLPPVGKKDVLARATWTLISTGTETIGYGCRFDPGTHWANYVRHPFHPGYSYVGVVEEVGPEVQGFQPGDRVYSMHEHRQFVVADESTFGIVPPGVSDRDAGWHALSGVVQNGIRRAVHELGDDVAIIGLGLLGQLTNQFVHLLGPRKLIVIDPVKSRLETAKAHGATDLLTMGVDESLEHIKKLTDGRLLDVVYDITGNDRVFAGAQKLLRRFGKLVLIGDAGSPSKQYLSSETITRSLQIIGSHGKNTPPTDTDWGHWTRPNMAALLFQYLIDGRMRLEDLNTHVFSPADAQQVYQKLLNHREGTMGCHFDWSKIR
jgi:2-desacetyl-2-hydroxyethyl bacteriochlorophyllide A dehydrogenase